MLKTCGSIMYPTQYSTHIVTSPLGDSHEYNSNDHGKPRFAPRSTSPRISPYLLSFLSNGDNSHCHNFSTSICFKPRRKRLVLLIILIMILVSLLSMLRNGRAVFAVTDLVILSDQGSVSRNPTLATGNFTKSKYENTNNLKSNKITKKRPSSHIHPFVPMPDLLIDRDDNTKLQETSACVLFSDDDQRLVEWLAYHYYAVGLRTLVIATNPLSSSTPTYILDRWRPYMRRIVEWNDADYGYNMQYKHTNISTGDATKHLSNHRKRQQEFYRKCINYLQKSKRADKRKTKNKKMAFRDKTKDNGWTWFHDLDEYITLDDKVVSNASAYMAQPSGVLKAWKHSKMNSRLKRNEWLFKPQTNIIRKRMKKAVQPCYSIPRLYVTTKGSIDEYDSTKNNTLSVVADATIPAFLDASNLETLKYRYRISDKTNVLNKLNKNLINVNEVIVNKHTKIDVHRVVYHQCSVFTPNIIFVINHYLGSWRLYARPSDARRGESRNWQWWHYRSQLGEPNDTIRPWLQSFVKNVGVGLAKTLLNPVPLPPAYNLPINMSEWIVEPKVYRSQNPKPDTGFMQYLNEWQRRHDEAMALAIATNSSKPLFVL